MKPSNPHPNNTVSLKFGNKTIHVDTYLSPKEIQKAWAHAIKTVNERNK